MYFIAHPMKQVWL